jgi:hypothetical protein
MRIGARRRRLGQTWQSSPATRSIVWAVVLPSVWPLARRRVRVMVVGRTNTGRTVVHSRRYRTSAR